MGQEIIQSHRQTLAGLEVLQELEEEVEATFNRANDIVEAEIVRNLQEEDLDELLGDSIPTQRYLRDFGLFISWLMPPGK